MNKNLEIVVFPESCEHLLLLTGQRNMIAADPQSPYMRTDKLRYMLSISEEEFNNACEDIGLVGDFEHLNSWELLHINGDYLDDSLDNLQPIVFIKDKFCLAHPSKTINNLRNEVKSLKTICSKEKGLNVTNSTKILDLEEKVSNLKNKNKALQLEIVKYEHEINRLFKLLEQRQGDKNNERI